MAQENDKKPYSRPTQSREAYTPTHMAGSGGRPPSPAARPSASATRPSASAARPAASAARPAASAARPASYSQPTQGRPSSTSRPGASSSRAQPTPPKTQSSGGGQDQPPRRKRRRRRMGPFGAVLYVLLVIGVSALLAGVGWICAGDVLALNKPAVETAVVVNEGASVGDVAKLLKENGLIEFKPIFRIFAAVSHAKDKITPGTYQLNTDMDYRALLSSMSKNSPNRTVVAVTLTEGMTESQIFKLLEENGVSTVAKLTETAQSYPFKFSFLQDTPLGDARRLEGYLFPDTYQFYMGGDPVEILNKMLLRFDEMFTEDMRKQVADSGKTVQEILTIASMIEKETDGEDQTTISSVIYNRLNKPTKETVGLLQIDATIAYVTGRIVTQADYSSVISPYNTYLNKGLPPTPIANPGMVAIHAAMTPESSKYYYYVLGDDGTHHFFKTLSGQKEFMATQELFKHAA